MTFPGGLLGEFFALTFGPEKVARTMGHMASDAGIENPFYDRTQAKVPKLEENFEADVVSAKKWARDKLHNFSSLSVLLFEGLTEARGTNRTRDQLSILLQSEGLTERGLSLLRALMFTPGRRHLKESRNRLSESLEVGGPAMIKVYNIDNYAHQYFRKKIFLGQDHERLDANYTGYGYSLSHHPLARSSTVLPSTFDQGCVWPDNLAEESLYLPVKHHMLMLLNSSGMKGNQHLTSPPNLLKRWEAPLGHDLDKRPLGMRFMPVDLYQWNIASNDGLLDAIKTTTREAIEDRSKLVFCRTDENIYRRITKVLSIPGSARVAQKWRNQFYVLSQWHGLKQSAICMWSRLYTPFYAFFYQRFYPKGVMLRAPRFLQLMQWNNGLCKMLMKNDNWKILEDACLKKPRNQLLQCLHEFLLIALPKVCPFQIGNSAWCEKFSVVLRNFFNFVKFIT